MSATAERVPQRRRFPVAGILEAVREFFREPLGSFPYEVDSELRCLAWSANWEPEALSGLIDVSYSVIERAILGKIERRRWRF